MCVSLLRCLTSFRHDSPAEPRLGRPLNKRTFPLVLLAMASIAVGQEPDGGVTSRVASDSWLSFRGDPLATGVAPGPLPHRLASQWTFRQKGISYVTTPTIDQGIVYVSDTAGGLRALDLATGKVRWHIQSGTNHASSPTLRDDRVYLGDASGRMSCHDQATGARRWEFQAGGPVDSSAVFHADQVLFGSQDKHLYCLSAATGKLTWKLALPDQIRASATVVEDRALVACCDGQFYVVSLATGAIERQVALDGPTGVTPAVRGDKAFVATEGGAVFCLDWRKGLVVWTYRGKQGTPGFRSSPAVTSDVVVIGSRNKQILALHPDSGQLRWSFAAKQRVDGSPVIVGDRAHIGAADGRLYVLDLKTGKKVDELELPAGPRGSVAIAAGRLVVATEDGSVLCFGGR